MAVDAKRLSGGAAQAAEGARRLFADLLDAFVALIAPLAARFAGRTRRVAILTGDDLVLYAVDARGQIERLGVIGAGVTVAPGPVELRLPAESFLRRSLALPAAGREYLAPIIAHRLERLTPWRPEHVLYGFRAEPGVAADGTMTVALLATSAERVAPLLARLEAAGLTPTSLGSVEDPIDAPPRIDLYQGRATAPETGLRRAVAVATLGALACLVPACLLTGSLADSAESGQAAVQERLAVVQRHLRGRSGDTASPERRLIEAKGSETGALVLLDRLSAALPDNTVLRELEIGRDRVRLAGRSGDAPALIGRLDGEAGLSGARFAAPVTRDSERNDLFDIVAARPSPAGRTP